VISYSDNERQTQATEFCSVLQPSSIQGLATPRTYFLHLSLSSVILTDSSTGSPVHVLMLSIQAVHGLPHLRAPGTVPCIISFSRQLPCFLMEKGAKICFFILSDSPECCMLKMSTCQFIPRQTTLEELTSNTTEDRRLNYTPSE